MLFARIKIIIVLVTSTRIEMTHQLSLDMRRNEPLWLILAWGSLLRIHGHGPCAVTFTGLASTDVEPCSIVSLKSGILLLRWPSTWLTLLAGRWRVALATPTTKKMFIQSLLAFSYYWVGVASVTLTTEPFSFLPFSRSVKRDLLLSPFKMS